MARMFSASAASAKKTREGLVDGLLDHGAAADPLVDDPARDLALAEARDLHLGADRLVRLVEHRLQLLERDLHDELDPGRADGLDGTLHFRHSTTMGESGNFGSDAVRAGPCGRRLPAAREHAASGSAPKDHASRRQEAHPIETDPPTGATAWVRSHVRAPDRGPPVRGTRDVPLHPRPQAAGAGALAAGVVATVGLGTGSAAATASGAADGGTWSTSAVDCGPSGGLATSGARVAEGGTAESPSSTPTTRHAPTASSRTRPGWPTAP